MGEVFSDEKLVKPLTRYAKQVENTNLKKQLTGLGPTLHSPRLETTKDIYLSNNVRLIKTIPDIELGKVQELFAAPENVGRTVSELAEMLEELFNISGNRASLIARDQTLKLNGQITKERQRSAGISGYIWTTSHDERVRGDPGGMWPVGPKGGGDHFRLDGTTQSWDLPPIVDDRTGRTAHPGEDYQCRCTAFPILGIEDDEEESSDDDIEE